MKRYFLAAAFLVTATISHAQEHQLVKIWETDTLLKVPEAVLYDAANKVLYVTNIDGQPWDRDNKGSVGKVGLDGKIITVDWVTGFSAPKGMGLYKNNLYVADVDKVAVIDIKKGVVSQTIPVEGAQGLNDITIDKKGVIYVSDSKNKKVHRIENGQVSTWLDNLKGPNGLLFNNNDLFVLDAGGLYKVEKDKSLTKLADGMEGGTDGVEHVKGKDYIVSCWAGTIWYVNGDGTKQNLLDTRDKKINTADIGYDAKNRIIYVPTFFKNNIVAYELK
ncbi:SMP-30/gluconolactonase/LRE family protein [Longitalea arenae]|uniref:SMP-30/gluconolactonase/LRE family protein n=1 Tax=Longitalea arenae TaxID=2812558 RepID=UPI0019679DDD|nr:SMP-30/gluconolactonase/LRE family protein [Longitalea arenae]